MPLIQTPHRHRLIEEIKAQVEAIHSIALDVEQFVHDEKVFPKSIAAKVSDRDMYRTLDRTANAIAEMDRTVSCLRANLKEEVACRPPITNDELMRAINPQPRY